MGKLVQAVVEAEIISAVEEINEHLKIGAKIDSGSCPGNIGGMSSQILLTIMSRLEDTLGIEIPPNIYIFHHKDEQLSIQQAAEKLIKYAEKEVKENSKKVKNGN